MVLIGPDFDGSSEAYRRLARVTGLVSYDLKARVRPGAWGLVKALGDPLEAESLAAGLSEAGFRPLLVLREAAHDPKRRIVHARGITLEEQGFTLHFTERDMPVEYGAVLCLVRGEVQPGRAALRGSGNSSAPYRIVTPVGEPPSTREVQQSPFESYHAADIHFLTVPWIARIDVRAVGSVTGEPSVRALDQLVDELAQRSGVRVDRAVRTSSLASFAEQDASRSTSSEPHGREHRREQPDERFDPYSRLVGEAERRQRG